MKLVLHIIGKDWAMLRGRLLTWLLVIVAKYAAGFFLIYRADLGQRQFGYLQAFVMVFTFTEGALTVVFAALLVHEDGLVGTNRFWMTRPVSGGRLLAAKVLGAALLLGVPPLFLAVPWWLACGLEPAQMAVAAGEMFGLQAGLVTLAFAVAVVTDGLGRFLVWGTIGFFSIEVISGLLSYAKPSANAGSRGLIQVAVSLATIGAVVALQYFVRHRPRALAIMLAGIGLGILAGRYAPWNILPPRDPQARLSPVNATLAASVTVEAVAPRVTSRVATRSGEMEMDYVDLRFRAAGLPPGTSVLGGSADCRWQWPGASTIHSFAHVYADADRAARSLLGIPESAHPPGGPTAGGAAPALAGTVLLGGQVRLGRSITARMKATPADYRVNLSLDLVRPELAVETPLFGAGWRASRGWGLRVMHVERERGLALPVVLASEPGSLLREIFAPNFAAMRGRETAFVVLHRRSGFVQTSPGFYPGSAFLSGVRLTGRILYVPGLRRDGADEPPEDRRAREEETTIAVVAFPLVARFATSAHLPAAGPER